MFNQYFHSVFTQSTFELPSSHQLPTPIVSVDYIDISELDVYTELVQLDTTKANDIIGFGPKVLKHCALALCHPIHHLFIIQPHQLQTNISFQLTLNTPAAASVCKSSV